MPGLSSLASLIPTLTAGASLASAGSGLYNSYENQKYQDMLRSYASSPSKLQSYAAGFTQPLAAGVSEGVNNQSQAYAAERGLATSPAASQQIENQAIAPYIQQDQQQGYQNALQALGLGGGATPNPSAAFGSLGTGLQALQKLITPSATTLASNIPTPSFTSTEPSTYIPPVPDPTLDMTSFSQGF
jgi:hypothetical protein